jgi:hypothetical protein
MNIKQLAKDPLTQLRAGPLLPHRCFQRTAPTGLRATDPGASPVAARSQPLRRDERSRPSVTVELTYNISETISHHIPILGPYSNSP